MASPITPESLRGIERPVADTRSIFAVGQSSRNPFCRWEVSLEDRPVFDASGNPSLEIRPQVGATLYHWASPGRAYAWLRYANALLSDRKRIHTLNAPVNTTDRNENRNQSIQQFQYVAESQRALANFYNCMNLVWHNDPVARALYRKWISGPPLQSVGVTSRSVFGEANDYNPAWYSGNDLYPKLAEGSGILQRAAMPSHGKGGRPGDAFAIGVTMTLAAASPRAPNVPVEYAPAVYNVPIVRTATMQTCPPEVGFPWTTQCEPFNQSTGLSKYPSESAGRGRGAVIFPNGMQLPNGFDDWRAIYHGQAYGNHIVTTAALVDYLPYLQEWVAILLTRTSWQTIQDARQFTIYENLQTLQLNGGPSAALQRITGSPADILAQQQKPDPGWQVAATSVAAVGAALGPVTSGISTLVGGAVSALILIGDAVSTHSVQGHGRDDLGRYKLLLERGWLSGRPEALDADNGQPVLPADPPDYKTSSILSPPGTWSDDECPAPGVTQGGPGSSGGAAKGTGNSTVGWLLGAAAVLVLAIAVTQRSKT